MKCQKCNGEMITIETGNTEIKTTFCKECYIIENSFYPHAAKELIKKAVRVGEDKDEKKCQKCGEQLNDVGGCENLNCDVMPF